MWLSLSALALAQGMRHALEPDHLAAVSALASEGRSARRTLRFAALWGAGHASMLFLVGGVLTWQRARMPEGLGMGLELVVALMLIVLGIRAIVQAARLGSAHHDADHAAPHLHAFGQPFALLPFGVGLVHGLAGSGALAALVLAMQPSFATSVAVLGVYSVGTMLGMALLAGVLGRPLQRLGAAPRAHRLLLVTAGALSLAMGVAWGAGVLTGPLSPATLRGMQGGQNPLALAKPHTTKSSSWIFVT